MLKTYTKKGKYLISQFKLYFTHRYLAQMIFTCIVMILIPCVFSLHFTIYHSFRQMQTESHEYYVQSSKNYFNCFLEEINSMISLSYSIRSDSFRPGKPANNLLPSKLSISPYYFSDATESIAFYRNTASNALIGIYYPNQDWLITHSYKHTAESYVTDSLNIDDPGTLSDICSFLKNSDSPKMDMYSLYPHLGSSGYLLMTVSTTIGHDKTPIIFLYLLDDSYIQTTFLESARYEALQFVIFDGETRELLFSSGSKNMEIFSDMIDFDSHEVKNGQTFSIKQSGQEYSCFLTHSSSMNFYYGIIGAYDTIYHSSLNYFQSMQFAIGGFIIILFLLLFALIYINYKPIYFLMQKLQKHINTNDLESISTTIDSMTDELSELNLILKDYMLENILIGKPINQTLLERLEIAHHNGNYQVYALSNIYLNTNDRITLTNELADHCKIPSFIIDILMQDITIIICLLPHDAKTNVTEHLSHWIRTHYPNAHIHPGSIVNSIDNLRDSFLACNIPEKENRKTKNKNTNVQMDEQTTLLAHEVLEYLQKNFQNPGLSQALVADNFNISTYTLSRLFKNQFGIGFAEFISNQRIEHAKHLLLTTNSPIGEIAAQVGIPNLNYFSRVFKGSQGVSPTQFREVHENTYNQ